MGIPLPQLESGLPYAHGRVAAPAVRPTAPAIASLCATALCAGILSACTLVASTAKSDKARAGVGVNYYLPKKLFQLEVTRAVRPADDCQFLDTFSVTPLPLMPDPNLRFSAILDHSIMRSDQLTLTTTRSGLLSGATGNGEDQTAQIILSLTNAIAARGTSLGATDTTHRNDSPAASAHKNCKDDEGSLKRIVDFSIAADRSKLNKELQAFGMALEVSDVGSDSASCTTPLDQVITSLCLADAPAYRKRQETVLKGLVYRRDLTHVLTFTSTIGGACGEVEKRLATLTIEMPNASPTEFLPMPTGAFTNVSYSAAFDNGMLTRVSATRPSEALGLAKLPYDIIVALVKIPAEIFELRVDLTTQQKSLADQQTALLQALQALQALEAERRKAESAKP